MAEESPMEIESAYEHMQVAQQRTNKKTEDTGCEKMIRRKASEHKFQIAVFTMLSLNFFLAIIGLSVISQESGKVENIEKTLEKQQSRIDELTGTFHAMNISTANFSSLIASSLLDINRTEQAVDRQVIVTNQTGHVIWNFEQMRKDIADVNANFTKLMEELRQSVKNNQLQLLTLQAGVEGVMRSSLRLQGGSLSSGRIEIFYNGHWGTICDDNWDINDARVVCRMLGYKNATSALHGASNGKGAGRIWLSNVNCTGKEATIWECEKDAWGKHKCDHSEDASVECV